MLKKSSLTVKSSVVVGEEMAVIEVDPASVDDLDTLLLAHISDSTGSAESQLIGLGGAQEGWVLLLVSFHAPIRRRLALWLDLRDHDAWDLINRFATVREITLVFQPLDEAVAAIERGEHPRGLVFPAPIETAPVIAGLSTIRQKVIGAG